MDCHTLIIGAGISGLITARTLTDSGQGDVVVVDKGRGLGGRMASRRWEGATFDHGAQFFTVRDKAFAAHVKHWQQAGFATPWFDKPQSKSDPDRLETAFRGIRGMTDAPKALANGLDVRRSWKAMEISRQSNGWIISSETGETLSGKRLIITTPAPQTLSLIRTAEEVIPSQVKDILSRVRYQRSLAALCLLDAPSGLAAPGGKKIDGKNVTWLADNQVKGISEVPALTIHSSPDFADRYWDEDDEVRLPLLWQEAGAHMTAGLLQGKVHRWGFAFPLQTAGVPFVLLEDLGLGFAGDSFGGPRVEAAALSGLALTARLLKRKEA